MKKIAYFIVFTLLFAGCTNLDETLYDKISGDDYPENDNQVANLTVEAYAKLQNLADDGGWWFLAQEISSDEMCCPTRDTDWDDGGKWRTVHQQSWGSSNDFEAVNNMWSCLWSGVTTCNQILDRFDQMEETESVLKKKAEMETFRSFFYYLLIDNFGDIPYLTSTVDAPEQPEKVKREVIYENLINTVTDNLTHLGTASTTKSMVTKYVGYAILAKLYLNAEVYTGSANWQMAEKYCDSLIESGAFTFGTDINAPFVTDNDANSEIIFSIPYDESTFQGFRFHMRSIHYQSKYTFNMTDEPWNGFATLEAFYDSYEDTDLRKQDWFLMGQQYYYNSTDLVYDALTGSPLIFTKNIPALYLDASYNRDIIRSSGARPRKYEIKAGAKENLSNDFVIFRITDFYLMRAEAKIRQGKNGDEEINMVRNRAGVNNISGATIEDLLAERGREMFSEGHRRQDLIRCGQWNKAWWEKPERTGTDIFPIPKWACDENPNLLTNL
ncbi:MAG: RagB/SusD family nutrient uptake outer membrane protein [Bacteroidales bacterium]|nr:RagB/SusD family nutrient uptake outer membrane protein [Bacteroidales bacterium]